MTLSGPQIKLLQDAILAAYNRNSLRRMLHICMEQDFDSLVSSGPFADQVFELIRWAESQSRTKDLVECACKDNPTNTQLQAAYSSIFGSRIIVPTNPPAPAPDDDERRAKPKGRLVGAVVAALILIAAIALSINLWKPFGPSAQTPTQTPAQTPTMATQIAASDNQRHNAATSGAETGPTATDTISAMPETPLPQTAPPPTPTPTFTATAVPPVTLPTNAASNMELVNIAAGDFTMGSDPNIDAGAYSDEQPQGTLSLSDFRIMRTEVTNSQYAQCVREGVCTAPGPLNQVYENPTYANYPVTDVDWHQATTYATWLGGYLPTEAEWEKACRGTDARIFPWGNEPSTAKANYDNAGHNISEVASYPPGANGLYDMAGNVWEWTSSKFRSYPYVASDGREDLESNGDRVLRGGAWYVPEGDVRCARRVPSSPSGHDNKVGFRVVFR